MEKKCFIIMPASDPDGYAQGHFNRVYQYIIVPACRLAGFSPARADDPAANDTPLDILRKIIESEIAICDLSSKNSNALYGFTIRHAINLPVTLIKDLKTPVLFDIQEFDLLEYDESLRIDTVQKEIEALSEVLTKTFANKAVINSLLSRFNIGSAPLIETPTYVTEPKNQEENPKKESHIPVITDLPDFVGDPIMKMEEFDKLKVGGFLFHMNYGKGEIESISKMAKDKIVKMQFESGSKLLVLTPSGVFRKINE